MLSKLTLPSSVRYKYRTSLARTSGTESVRSKYWENAELRLKGEILPQKEDSSVALPTGKSLQDSNAEKHDRTYFLIKNQ